MTFDLGPALLFVPGDRPERIAKALERADAAIIDLEDAVGADVKDAARGSLAAVRPDPARTLVRVNAPGTPWFEADVEAVRAAGLTTVVLPKAEGVEALAALEGLRVVAQIETAAGVLSAPALAAHPSVVALTWGPDDLVASLGGMSPRRPDGSYLPVVQHARAQVALAAAAFGKAAIDAVWPRLDDLAGLLEEADDAVASGFAGKACVHPDQVWVVRGAYQPSAEAVAAAERVLAAASEGDGVCVVDGRMVDAPALRHARTVVSRAKR